LVTIVVPGASWWVETAVIGRFLSFGTNVPRQTPNSKQPLYNAAMKTRAQVATTVSLAESNRLQQLAEDRRVSLSDLLRHAIAKTYPSVKAAKEAEDESW